MGLGSKWAQAACSFASFLYSSWLYIFFFGLLCISPKLLSPLSSARVVVKGEFGAPDGLVLYCSPALCCSTEVSLLGVQPPVCTRNFLQLAWNSAFYGFSGSWDGSFVSKASMPLGLFRFQTELSPQNTHYLGPPIFLPAMVSAVINENKW